jgi:surface polysaccharide O-acyltransferase-like enzyme
MEVQSDNGTERRMAVDIARVLAAAAVVWIHVVDCDASRTYLALCRFAVPFFTCVAVYFVLQKATSTREASFGNYCMQRAVRLYVPFLLWALFYLGVRMTKHAVAGAGSPITLSPAVLLNGTAHHLWFLPFICLVSIVMFALGRLLIGTTRRQRRWLAGTLLVAGAAVAFGPDPVDIRAEEAPITYFADHALDTLPSVFFGAAAFCLGPLMTSPLWVRVSLLASTLLCVLWEFFNGGSMVGPHIAGASLLLMSITQPNRRWMPPVAQWANLAFVVYLVHVVFVEGLDVIEQRFGGVDSLSADVSVWALALVASALTAKLLSRVRSFRWAFPQ